MRRTVHILSPSAAPRVNNFAEWDLDSASDNPSKGWNRIEIIFILGTNAPFPLQASSSESLKALMTRLYGISLCH